MRKNVPVEVFKTNVTSILEANKLVDLMHQTFRDYSVNFDLEDCDKILRVASMGRNIKIPELICFMEKCGYQAEVLPDDQDTDIHSNFNTNPYKNNLNYLIIKK